MFAAKSLALFRLLFLLSLCGCNEEILHDLNEFQANRTIVALSRSGIVAEKTREGTNWSVRVSSNNAADALEVLSTNRMLSFENNSPPERSNALVQSREEREHFLERNISTSIEQTLERLPSVLDARVHLHLQTTNRLSLLSSKTEESASVLLVLASRAAELAAAESERVKLLVSGASGVPVDSVTVVSVDTAEKPRATPTPVMPQTQSELPAQLPPGASIVSSASPLSFLGKKSLGFLLAGILIAAGLLAMIRSIRANDQRLKKLQKNTK